mmetsp:Transcript_65032/g.172178  ORF Transcript_65032/g.172178 Transcript_65032/m.172178 type:complete len:368 (-) Transcript_65032:340-1443(-)
MVPPASANGCELDLGPPCAPVPKVWGTADLVHLFLAGKFRDDGVVADLRQFDRSCVRHDTAKLKVLRKTLKAVLKATSVAIAASSRELVAHGTQLAAQTEMAVGGVRVHAVAACRHVEAVRVAETAKLNGTVPHSVDHSNVSALSPVLVALQGLSTPGLLVTMFLGFRTMAAANAICDVFVAELFRAKIAALTSACFSMFFYRGVLMKDVPSGVFDWCTQVACNSRRLPLLGFWCPLALSAAVTIRGLQGTVSKVVHKALGIRFRFVLVMLSLCWASSTGQESVESVLGWFVERLPPVLASSLRTLWYRLQEKIRHGTAITMIGLYKSLPALKDFNEQDACVSMWPLRALAPVRVSRLPVCFQAVRS